MQRTSESGLELLRNHRARLPLTKALEGNVERERDLRGTFQMLGLCILASYGGFIAFMFAFFSPEADTLKSVREILVLVMVAGGALFYVFLGVLATKLKKSLLVWVGGAFVLTPAGPIVAYFRMKRLVAENEKLPNDRRTS